MLRLRCLLKQINHVRVEASVVGHAVEHNMADATKIVPLEVMETLGEQQDIDVAMIKMCARARVNRVQ